MLFSLFSITADIHLLFHFAISSVKKVHWSWNLDVRRVSRRTFYLMLTNLCNWSKFYCYKGLNNTYCFEYNRILENRCFMGEDYILSLEAFFFGILDEFWSRKHRLEKIALKCPRVYISHRTTNLYSLIVKHYKLMCAAGGNSAKK